MYTREAKAARQQRVLAATSEGIKGHYKEGLKGDHHAGIASLCASLRRVDGSWMGLSLFRSDIGF